MPDIPLPLSTRNLLKKVSIVERHPGLQLDKLLTPCEDQEQQKKQLDLISQISGENELLQSLFKSHRPTPVGNDCLSWTQTTVSPLTLHLARASALENAGLCLHPIYGFAYLPGTGLKGLAHAYACEIWLPEQPNREVAWDQICEVFGWADSPALADLAKRLKLKVPKGAKAGSIIFHEAWPTSWPKLFVDIVNNHYPKYYRSEAAPGDWDSPNPVYFLAIESGTTFDFRLQKRRWDIGNDLLNLGLEWLQGGLCHLGCGAKTNAGYGCFKAVEKTPELKTPSRSTFEATLELVTPAFLAGANQARKEDCDLRPATMRGLLRWWWRTMHVGFVDVNTLREMESCLWGSAEVGGAIRITIQKSNQVGPQLCPLKTIRKNRRNQDQLVYDSNFGDEHGIPRGPQGMTQGVEYAAYGMDEMATGDLESRKQRWFAPSGSRWQLQLHTRECTFRGRNISKEVVCDQAKTALWWFCKLGGVGSRSRKGFGSFYDPPELNDFEGGRWLTQGKQLRDACGLEPTEFDVQRVQSASLKLMRELGTELELSNLPWVEIDTSWDDPWLALDQVGASLQAFAQADPSTGHGKHCPEKRGLGIPRQIHGPSKRPMRHQNERTHQRPFQLRGPYGDRHSSPVFYHLSWSQRGTVLIRVVAFPTKDLRDPKSTEQQGLEDSRWILKQLLLHSQDDLTKRSSTI